MYVCVCEMHPVNMHHIMSLCNVLLPLSITDCSHSEKKLNPLLMFTSTSCSFIDTLVAEESLLKELAAGSQVFQCALD